MAHFRQSPKCKFFCLAWRITGGNCGHVVANLFSQPARNRGSYAVNLEPMPGVRKGRTVASVGCRLSSLGCWERFSWGLSSVAAPRRQVQLACTRLASRRQLPPQDLHRRPSTSHTRPLQRGRQSELHRVAFADHPRAMGWALTRPHVTPRVSLRRDRALMLGHVSRGPT